MGLILMPNDLMLEKRFICLCQSLNRISLDVRHTDFYSKDMGNIYRSFCAGEYNPTEQSCKRFKFTLESFYDAMESGEFGSSNFNSLAKSILSFSLRRKNIIDAQNMITRMQNVDADVSIVVDKPVTAADVKDEIIDQWTNTQPFKLHSFYRLNENIKTFDRGHVLLLCGMSGTGKTNFAIQFCDDICNSNGEKWLFVSLEMQKKSIFERIFKTTWYRNNPNAVAEYGEYEAKRACNLFFEKNKSNPLYYDKCINNNMYILDISGLDILGIERVIKGQLERDNSTGTVVIDFAQLISHTTDDYKALSEISRKVPEFAKKYNVRIILLSQLTKDNYDNVRPTPRAIKGAGGLYDNADEVWCLYSESETPNIMKILHWKGRFNGFTGETELYKNGLYLTGKQNDY